MWYHGKHELKLSLKSVFIVFWAAILAGCATPAAVEKMAAAVPATQTSLALKNSVGVADVTGGKETNPMWTSQVSSEGFRQALEQSLENAGMFNKVVAGSKYQLSADLTRLDQPLIGFNFTVTSTVRYALIETRSRKPVYERVIQADYTASMVDAFLSTQRMKLANEGAVKANIRAFLSDLVALKLPE